MTSVAKLYNRSRGCWAAVGMLWLFALLVVAMSTAFIALFRVLGEWVLPLVVVAWALGLWFSLQLLWRHRIGRHKKEMAVVCVSHLVALLSTGLFHIGFGVAILALSVQILLLMLNAIYAKNRPMLLFFNANTLLSMLLSVTIVGLIYAHFVSSDWLSLYLAMIAVWAVGGTGAVGSTIALLSKKRN